MQEAENPKIKPVRGKNGGARPGSGRKKGQLAPQTIERAKILKEFRERVAKHADLLFDYQFTLARGCTVLYRVEKDKQGNDKAPQMVTDQSEVEEFLAGNLDDDNYRFITTEKPDNRAIDSLLDRTFGKADSKIDLTSQGERLQAAPVIISPIAPRNAPTQE
jgi:hypothetical protein